MVLVIDSTDRERLPQVKAEMIKLLVNVDLAKAVFLGEFPIPTLLIIRDSYPYQQGRTLCPLTSYVANLVLANKQDLADAMTAHEISEGLELHAIKSHEWHIQGACVCTAPSQVCLCLHCCVYVTQRLLMLTKLAPAGEGLEQGLDWIAARLA